jgi:hypothetical protein
VPAAAADAVVELPPPAAAVIVGALPALVTTGVEVGAAALDESPLPLSGQLPPKQLHP